MEAAGTVRVVSRTLTDTATLRVGSREDLAAIAELERRGFARGERWAASELARAIDDERSHCVLAVDGTAVIGYALATRSEDGVEIVGVTVAPRWRGRGVGRRLVESVLVWSGDARVTLEVRVDNEGARALYASLGFVARGRVAGYYGVHRDALVMVREAGRP